MQPEPPKQPWQYIVNRTVFSILGQVGCITFVFAVGSVIVGLAVDQYFGTRPMFTLLLMVGGVPLAAYIVYRRVKAATAGLVPKKKGDGEVIQEKLPRE